MCGKPDYLFEGHFEHEWPHYFSALFEFSVNVICVIFLGVIFSCFVVCDFFGGGGFL